LHVCSVFTFASAESTAYNWPANNAELATKATKLVLIIDDVFIAKFLGKNECSFSALADLILSLTNAMSIRVTSE
jgi:hypothetical protein